MIGPGVLRHIAPYAVLLREVEVACMRTSHTVAPPLPGEPSVPAQPRKPHCTALPLTWHSAVPGGHMARAAVHMHRTPAHNTHAMLIFKLVLCTDLHAQTKTALLENATQQHA